MIAGLDDGSRLLLHLGMTGQLFTAGASSVRLLSAATRATLAPEAQPRFTPDAQSIFFISDRDGVPNLYRVGIDSGELSRVTNVRTGVSGITS